MRHWRVALAVASVVALTSTGCTRAIEGVAQPDPHKPGIALSSDGYGVVTGFADAPVQLELFTEPQCDHCADLQHEFGDKFKNYLESGRLSIVYRPLTFLDDAFGNDYSAMASNALFLAVDPATSAGMFQAFVEDLWANQDLSMEDYTDDDFGDLANESGLPATVVDNIRAGKSAVDTGGMDTFNAQTLLTTGAGTIHTPVVYDLGAKAIVDTSDDAWLDKLMKSA